MLRPISCLFLHPLHLPHQIHPCSEQVNPLSTKRFKGRQLTTPAIGRGNRHSWKRHLIAHADTILIIANGIESHTLGPVDHIGIGRKLL